MPARRRNSPLPDNYWLLRAVRLAYAVCRMSSISKAVQLASRLAKIGVCNPQRLSYVLGTALSASDAVVDRSLDLLRLPRVDVNELLPEAGEPLKVELALFPKTYASVSVLEFICLVLLLKRTRAERIFEFGTYKGVSITQLALNVPPGREIYTLDLPDEPIATRLVIADPEDADIAVHKGKGSLIPADLRPRITFLKQDSARFDESPYVGRMDFVFVDGAHNYDYVKNDSEKAWRMLRSGGIIVWHDFRPPDPGVVKYLLESAYKPLWVYGTALAFATKP